MNDAPDLDQLRRDAENPLIAPSGRVAARKAFRAIRDGEITSEAAAAMRWAMARGLDGSAG